MVQVMLECLRPIVRVSWYTADSSAQGFEHRRGSAKENATRKARSSERERLVAFLRSGT
jgi:hypothetical protein